MVVAITKVPDGLDMGRQGVLDLDQTDPRLFVLMAKIVQLEVFMLSQGPLFDKESHEQGAYTQS